MAQHDYVIANGTGADVRADLNDLAAAAVSLNSGTAEPATMYAYMLWADTTLGLLKIRDSGNAAWIILGRLAGFGATLKLNQLSGSATVSADDDIVEMSATGTATLPSSASMGTRRKKISLVNTGTGVLTIASSDSISGQTSITVDDQWGFVTVFWNGTTWRQIS